jgi:tRNA U34 5-methylaminomethyl-2-thiouridine-forming methyltransferase MnmC
MKKNHELVVFPNGTATLRDPAAGEAMHSAIGPLEEAGQVHVLQAGLEQRLLRAASTPLVIHDIGMGLAANALATVEFAARLGSPRHLHLISFENDPSGLSTALGMPGSFPFLVPWRPALEHLLARGIWQSQDGKVRWELRTGDVSKADLSPPAPEIVYFDPYSPKSQPALWGVSLFSRFHRAMSRDPGARPILTTYSAATSTRTALLLAGFFVGRGRATALKRETTLAALLPADLECPLDANWLEKLARSEKPFPPDCEGKDRSELLQTIAARLATASPSPPG